MRIALFVTCLADTLFPAAARATVTILERLGHEVVFPPDQTCCGQMHLNTGYQRAALPLIRRHVRTFLTCDVVVAPSASCVASVRHQHATNAWPFGPTRSRPARTSCPSYWSTCWA
jgi:L-lactate dehydrogenase complex protein LldE